LNHEQENAKKKKCARNCFAKHLKGLGNFSAYTSAITSLQMVKSRQMRDLAWLAQQSLLAE
jgi:hypothetical protein